MSLLQSIIYGLIIGLTEFLPISSRGHQLLLKEIMGVQTPTPLADILIYTAMVFAMIVSSKSYIFKILRYSHGGSRRPSRNHHIDRAVRFDLRLIQGSLLPMIIVMSLQLITKSFCDSLLFVALMFTLNGVILYFPEHIAHGNKDASKLSALDGVLLGVCRALSVIPGLSGVGASISCSLSRGADIRKSINWILLISIPALICMIVLEIIGIFISGIGIISFAVFVGYLLAAMVAFAATLGGIYLIRYVAAHSTFSGFAFYCWGAALLSFILYLTT